MFFPVFISADMTQSKEIENFKTTMTGTAEISKKSANRKKSIVFLNYCFKLFVLDKKLKRNLQSETFISSASTIFCNSDVIKLQKYGEFFVKKNVALDNIEIITKT